MTKAPRVHKQGHPPKPLNFPAARCRESPRSSCPLKDPLSVVVLLEWPEKHRNNKKNWPKQKKSLHKDKNTGLEMDFG